MIYIQTSSLNMVKKSRINNQSNFPNLNFTGKDVFQLCIVVILLFVIQGGVYAQVPKKNIEVNSRVTQSATTTITQQATAINENPKRLNLSSATLKNEFSALGQGDYSIVSLKLPGSDKVSDYYVKKSGSKLILNGDIIVGDFSIQSTMSYTKDDETHTFGKDDLYRWPNGTVPVVLENSVFDGNNYNVIKSALDYFNFNTGIIFKERGGEKDYLVIKCVPDDATGKAGSSAVGRQRNGNNILELIKGKFTMGTVLHELMHTLGVLHEQSREDRDNFVEIKWDNIKESAKHDFQIEDNATVRSAYDYCSVMEYPSQSSFAIDPAKPTIVCKTNGMITDCPACMGNRVALTKMDLDGLDKLYGGIGISRFPSQMPFVSAKVPIAGCIGVADNLIRAKWDVYKNALGDCQTAVISLGIFKTTYVQFEYGQIYHSPHGVFAVYGDIYQLFKAQNGMGNFGFPLRDEEDINDADKGIFASWNKAGYTRVSKFEKGVIIWGPQKKAKALTNEIFIEGPHPLSKTTVTEKEKVSSGSERKVQIKTSQSIKKITKD
jgi:hypothetical protein